MKKKLTKNQRLAKAIEILLNGKPADRITACRESFPLFLGVYFNHYIKAAFADFHYDIMDNLIKVETGEIYEYALVAFRYSAKTSLVKAWLTWIACYKKRNYVVVTSYDETNSEAILNTIAHNLTEIGNPLLYSDMLYYYGTPLYTKERAKDEVTTKTKGMFQLSNGVWFESGSVNTVFRGRQSPSGSRIDLVVMDDIENTRTVASPDMTLKIRKQMDELRSAGDLMNRLSVVYLGNKISKYGNIAFLQECAGKFPKFVYHEIPLIDDEGNVMWKAYTPERIKELRLQFADTFNAEFLNKPDEISDIFKPQRETFLKCIEDVEPKKNVVLIGVDTGENKYMVVGNLNGLFVAEYWDVREKYKRVRFFLDKYPHALCCIDGQGDPTATAELIADYPDRVFKCYFRQDGKNEEFVRLDEEEGTILADKHRLTTFTHDEFATERITLHGEQEYWDELYISHWTNMMRVSKPTSLGVRKMWERKGGDHKNGDHLAMATVYWRALVSLYEKIKPQTSVVTYANNSLEVINLS